jgi:hypothetical protein
MTSPIAAKKPDPVLCKNLELDFNRIAKSHGTVGRIWRVAAIVFAVAAAALLIGMIVLQFGATVTFFEVVVLFGSFGGLAALATHLIWKAGDSAFTQQTFYQLVADRVTHLEANWTELEIQNFFNEQEITLPTNAKTLELLSARAPAEANPIRAFLPAIAHFEVLNEQLNPQNPGKEFEIQNARRALDKMNAAAILQTLHRPTENVHLKFDEHQVDQIPGLGRFDLIGLIAKTTESAFIFDLQKGQTEPKEAIKVESFQCLEPKDLRALMFEVDSVESQAPLP